MTAAEIAAEQAEDEGLWFITLYASEAYLQAALRRLTAAVEDEAFLAGHYASIEKRYGEILDERERLKALVKSAFIEGNRAGRSVGDAGCPANAEYDWAISRSRAALEAKHE